MAEPGLRERKRQQTHRRIKDAATRMFAERGFDRVRVAEVARAADVSEATVFNYFPTKEDLVYGEMETFEEVLLAAIRNRPDGTTVLSAFREFLLNQGGSLEEADPEATRRIATAARIVAASAALQTREQQVVDRTTRSLAAIVAEEGGAGPDDIRPWVVANALTGVNRAMTRAVHAYAIDGRSGTSIARDVRDQAEAALDLLERGLAD